ncbi:hypothetical protein J27TS8_25090 [Robertmurraya siralis]|uniref:Uncharacterized protein n=1 Tax=Robertmurraya siralis TaxID=77777 RepID=A0A919WI90_9BACI|nr:hypothetical protein [Robertmurraya siralis]GIN62516.1 hypothetical protein J27TS8_25090 [Robertmurraya siralis]
MAIFKTASEKAIKLKERIQERREGLFVKQEQLQEELKFLYSKKEDEFAEAVLNDDKGYSDTKINKDIDKVRNDITDVQRQLADLEHLEATQMQIVKGELNEEYNAVRRAEQDKLTKVEDKLRLIKIEYLEALVGYREEVRKSEAKLRDINTARQQTGVKTYPVDMAMGFHENVYNGGEINPMIMISELRESFQGRFPYHETTVAKYKK